MMASGFCGHGYSFWFLFISLRRSCQILVVAVLKSGRYRDGLSPLKTEGWEPMQDPEVTGRLVEMHQLALDNLATARGLVAAWERRASQAQAELLRIGFIPGEQLPYLGLQVAPIPIEPLDPVEQHLHQSGV